MQPSARFLTLLVTASSFAATPIKAAATGKVTQKFPGDFPTADKASTRN